MSKLTNSTETVRDCTVSLLRGGSGPPLLFLHGAGGGGIELPFMTRLAERYDLIAPEHPGFGGSDEPDWFDNIHDVAYFYLDFLEHLDLAGVHLAGMSLGGWIAMEVAVRSTARLASLTLVCPAGVHVPGLATGDPFAWSPEETFRQGFHDRAFAEAAIARLPEAVEADDIWLKNRSSFARLAWEPRLHDPHLPKWLHRIDVPTHIVWGAHDNILSADHAEAIAGMIPGAGVTVVPEAAISCISRRPMRWLPPSRPMRKESEP
ncbi:MAG: alpha/beta hydrolase [Rhodospirillaceae bacterium]|nr:alpha/beta hydrolase [Rhodospirillaceae bacterium]MDE0616809.1 alpha/beta hydrolase [Rhodospirillaceae bacterium]